MQRAPFSYSWKDNATLRLSLICDELEKIVPSLLAEEYDNVGLLFGDAKQQVTTVSCALEATEQTVKAAAEQGAELLLVHHPFIFKPLKKIDLGDPIGRVMDIAFKNGVAIYACHTNFDSVKGGLNDALAQAIGLKDATVFPADQHSSMVKLVTFMPDTHVEKVSAALFGQGAGIIGNYTGCSFRIAGHGTFIPGQNADPHSGRIGESAREHEIRVEVVLPEFRLAQAIEAMMKAHPYDEVAYDVYPLKNKNTDHGFGRVAVLEKPTSLKAFAQHVKKSLKLDFLRVVGKGSAKIKKAVVCSGSGAFFIPMIKDPQGTCLVTGDVKYHDALLAQQRGLSVIDAGHFGTEILFVKAIMKLLKNRFSDKIKIVGIFKEKDLFSIE